jgi:hypothetical protein
MMWLRNTGPVPRALLKDACNALQRTYEIVLCIKGIVSRDFFICFLESFDRSEVFTHMEPVRLPLKFRLRVEIFDFLVSA